MTEKRHISLSELLSQVGRALETAFPAPVWVAAEIADLRVAGTGHCYMEVVEKGNSSVPRASARAVVWRGNWLRLSRMFSDAAGAPLAAGMKILVSVSVSYHELYGFSLTISDIDPTYTLGEAERQRRETIARLQTDGVFDMNRAIELPPLIQRVAVISSASAAGWRDFTQELARYPWRIDVTLYEAIMQGTATEESVITALEGIAGRMEDFDAVVVIRGGGSTTDLAAFDGYRLCSHLAQFPLPIITGIGHDKDRSVADMVAAVELKTPTAVAVWLAEGVGDFAARIDETLARVTELSQSILERERLRLERAGRAMSLGAMDLTRRLEMRLGRLHGEVARLSSEQMLRENHRLAGFDAFFAERPAMFLTRAAERLDAMEGAVAMRRPENILALGFAIVRTGGKALLDPALVAPDQLLEIALARGELTARKV